MPSLWSGGKYCASYRTGNEPTLCSRDINSVFQDCSLYKNPWKDSLEQRHLESLLIRCAEGHETLAELTDRLCSLRLISSLWLIFYPWAMCYQYIASWNSVTTSNQRPIRDGTSLFSIMWILINKDSKEAVALTFTSLMQNQSGVEKRAPSNSLSLYDIWPNTLHQFITDVPERTYPSILFPPLPLKNPV